MAEEIHTIPTPDGDMGVVVRRPDDDGPHPVVVLFHHGPGLDEGSREAMQRIADAGYYVVSHDRYHREGPFVTFDRQKMAEEGEEAFKRFFAVLQGTTDEMVASDVAALLTFIDGQPAAAPPPMGTIGYCIGARSVILTLHDHPDLFAAGVGLHPSFCATEDADSPHHKLADMDAHVYMGIAGDDSMISEEERARLAEAVDGMGHRGDVDAFAGADHGYGVPGPRYEADAADQAYAKALDLFSRTLS
jgi:carboxymethylenebutenolidase